MDIPPQVAAPSDVQEQSHKRRRGENNKLLYTSEQLHFNEQ